MIIASTFFIVQCNVRVNLSLGVLYCIGIIGRMSGAVTLNRHFRKSLPPPPYLRTKPLCPPSPLTPSPLIYLARVIPHKLRQYTQSPQIFPPELFHFQGTLKRQFNTEIIFISVGTKRRLKGVVLRYCEKNA